MTRFLQNNRLGALIALAGLLLSVDVGCGRATLGDPLGFGGAGGAGGSSNSSSVSSTNNSSSSGGVCDCKAFCAALDPCGFGSPSCVSECGQGFDPDLMQCACDAPNCDELLACANKSTTAVTVGTSSSGVGGSGGFTSQCEDCANDAAQQQCQFQVNDCGTDPACLDIFDCMGNCGWGPNCENQCVTGPSSAINAFYSVISCAICQSCFDACSTSDIVNLCFDDVGG